MAETQKYLIRDAQGNVYGPADAALLRDWVGQGRIVAGMFIAERETRQWVEASTHPTVADLLQPKSQPRPAQPGPPATPRPTAVQPKAATPSPSAQPRPDSGEIELRPAPPAPARPSTAVPTRPAPVPTLAQEGQYYSATSPAGPRQNVCGLIGFIASLVGAVMVVFACVPFCNCIGLPMSALLEVTAIVLGSIGLYQIRENPEAYQGRGLALTALIIGAIVLVLYVIGIVIGVGVNALNHP